ncbi:unnamed protein product [Caenorhabditis auriculariae]|uniref:Uncharacterized protein n=1 Tax=Caenorhabditis auriculariae TaxID=2777116 RepID=A0A8S1H823_9PELO|nr:unnamed protein product [Caenorhabditis auriculariae]
MKLRGIVVFAVSEAHIYPKVQVHLLESRKLAILSRNVIVAAGYREKDLRLGDVLIIDVKSKNGNIVAEKLCKVEPRQFYQCGKNVTGQVFKATFGSHYIITNDVLGVIGDPYETLKFSENGSHQVQIVLPPLKFYRNKLDPLTVFSEETPFLVQMVPKKLKVTNEESIRCEGIVISHVPDRVAGRIYAFTEGCSPYTDILGLTGNSCKTQFLPPGTFVSFSMSISDYERRENKKNLQMDFSTVRFFKAPENFSTSVEGKRLYLTIKNFSMDLSSSLSYPRIGKFDDPDGLLSPNKKYEEVKFLKVSGVLQQINNSWKVVAATEGSP